MHDHVTEISAQAEFQLGLQFLLCNRWSLRTLILMPIGRSNTNCVRDALVNIYVTDPTLFGPPGMVF